MEEKLRLSPIAFGLWRLTESKLSDNQLLELIETCLEHGITTFDHADIYGAGEAQIQFGRVLAANPHLRKQMTIVSKCGIVRNPQDDTNLLPSFYETSYNYILNQVELILSQLQIEVLDVLLIHRVDHLMDYKEVARAFRDLKASGKVKHFGVSNFLVPQLDALIKEFPEIEVNQIQISVDYLEHFKNGVIERCAFYDLTVMAWSPLGGGAVFNEDYKNNLLKTKLHEIKDQLEIESLDQLMLAWIMKHPLKIVPVLGTMKVHRILSALGSCDIELSHKHWYELYTHSQLERLP